jgi:hypothetical protein
MADQSAFGTSFGRSASGATGTYTAVAMVRDFNGPGLINAFDESTHHQSTGSYSQYVPTTHDVGEITFEIAYDPNNATHDPSTGLIQWWTDKSIEFFDVVFPDATHWYFQGYVGSFTPKAPVKGLLAADVMIKPSGPMNLS